MVTASPPSQAHQKIRYQPANLLYSLIKMYMCACLSVYMPHQVNEAHVLRHT